MDLPDGGALTWSGLIGGAAAALIILRRVLSGQSVELATNASQVNMIANLQAERDAAVKRADEAVADRETAMQAMNGLQIQIVQLQSQIQQLSSEVAALRQAAKA